MSKSNDKKPKTKPVSWAGGTFVIGPHHAVECVCETVFVEQCAFDASERMRAVKGLRTMAAKLTQAADWMEERLKAGWK